MAGSWAALSNFTVAGLAYQAFGNSLYYVGEYCGEKNVPGDIRRLRRSVSQLMRRMGQPVIVKHMYNEQDAEAGLAKPSPSGQSVYGSQVRNRDPFSYGTGYCSIELSTNEWITPDGTAIITSDLAPSPNYTQAPRYRGYGPGFLTYLIEPDVAIDVFKLAASGALIKTQSQTVVAAWWPEIGDNDLVINVELDKDGWVVDHHERYTAKKTAPVSIRGLDQRGRREGSSHGNRHVVNQNLEMALLPETSVLYHVEAGR